MELYKGKHGQSEKQYQDGRSDAGKMISGDSKTSGAAYSARGVKNTGPNPAGGSERPKAQGRMGSKDRAYLAYRKGKHEKEGLMLSFNAYLDEKKSQIRINPRKADLYEKEDYCDKTEPNKKVCQSWVLVWSEGETCPDCGGKGYVMESEGEGEGAPKVLPSQKERRYLSGNRF